MVNEADKELRKMLSRGNIGSSLTFLISLFIQMGAVGKRRFSFPTPFPIIIFFTRHLKKSQAALLEKSSKDEYNSS